MRTFFVTCTFLFLSAIAMAEVPQTVGAVVPYLVRIQTIGGYDKVGSELTNEGTSTGVLLDQEGYIITGAFNFLHDPASILLSFHDGTKKIAKKIATDKQRMLTLLQAQDFSAKELLALPMRNKSSLRIGEPCIAVGKVFSTKPNITQGIISGKDRIWGKAIQTDAAIGPNNYGGLLIDREGNVLGIPVPLDMMSQDITAGAEMYDAGVGLAIPWEDMLTLLPKLKEGKDLLPGMVGLGFKENQTFVGDSVIAMIQPDSPADKAGLKVGDKIVRMDDVPMTSAMDVTKNLRVRYAGETLTFVILRDGKEQTVTLSAAAMEMKDNE